MNMDRVTSRGKRYSSDTPSYRRSRRPLLIAAIIVAGIALALLLLRGLSDEDTWVCENGEWVRHGNPSAAMPTEPCPTNENGNANTEAITSFDECANAGFPVSESFPRQCTANGETFTENIGNELDKADLITIATPRPNEAIESPLTVSGEARGTWFFEGSFPIVLRDADGDTIATANAQADGEWMTEEFVDYTATLTFEAPSSATGTLLLQKNNPSGLEANDDELNVPVRFSDAAETADTRTVEVFFGQRTDSEDDCSTVAASTRTIPQTPALATAAMNQLLAGLTEAERASGYTNSLPTGVTLNRLAITDGIAYADFSEKLQEGVSGSCRVTQIRAQITETLKQFSTVDSVVISVEGETEGILQP